MRKPDLNRIRNWAMAGLIPALVLAWAGPALADTPARPRAYVKASANQRYQIRMTPQGGLVALTDTGRVLYRLNWYAFPHQVILLNDGRTLVRHGPWATRRSGMNNLGLAFYRDGREIRRYTVGDLLTDPTRIRRTVSHFFWRDNRSSPGFSAGLSADQRYFTLGLLDGTCFSFRTDTGRIARKWRRRPLPPRW
jgi:hypothetical protein